MSLLVFSGGAQLATVPLMLTGAPVWIIVATAFCVNLRFIVFSAHLRPYFIHLRLRERLVFGYLMGDLSYVMFIKRYPTPALDEATRVAQMSFVAGSCLLNWGSWVLSSLLGIMLSNLVPDHWGLGFTGVLALIGVSCSLASSRLRAVSAVVSAAAAVVCFALPLRLNIAAAICIAVAICMALERTSLTHRRST